MARDTRASPVAYLVLSHDKPRQVLRLVDRLVRSDLTGHVVIEHDGTRDALELGLYARHPRVHLLTGSAERRWGNYGLVADLLDAIGWTLAHLNIGWIAVMSGQDYPLGSLASFAGELAESGFDAFVEPKSIPRSHGAASDSGERYSYARYHYRWYELPSWLLRWARGRPVERLIAGAQRRLSAAQPLVFVWSLPRGAGDMIGFRRWKLPFRRGFQCYMGSQWLTISRPAAIRITDFVRMRPDVVRLYQRSIIPDESMLVTILANDPSIRVCGSNHHYTRMTGPGQSHAAVLGIDDLDELRNSAKPFARKFDEDVDREILDRLDADILVTGSLTPSRP